MLTNGNKLLHASLAIYHLPLCRSLAKEKLTEYIIITGYCKLSKYLYKMDIVIDPICKGCNEEDERIDHVLCYCAVHVRLWTVTIWYHWFNMSTVADATRNLAYSVHWLAYGVMTHHKNEDSTGLLRSTCKVTCATVSFDSHPSECWHPCT